MTFIVSPNGVNNTSSTTAKFGPVGSVRVGGHFENSGNVEVDIRANLEVLGNMSNSGNFSIKDYVTAAHYKMLETAISDLNGEAKEYLKQTYAGLRTGDTEIANSWFKKFVGYIKDHPELITSSVQIILALFK